MSQCTLDPVDFDRAKLKNSLYVAYRKAKADVFYQSSDRMKLLEYELALDDNLEEILDAIVHGPSHDLFSNLKFTGTATYIPKSLDFSSLDGNTSSGENSRTVVFTSPEEQWRQVVSASKNACKPNSATFRLMSNCGIGLHVLSALWIMEVGDEIEKNLVIPMPFANRIRRTRAKNYNSSSLGTFERYLDGYTKWIKNATEAMEDLINSGKKVASFSTDAAEYFHRIPASILDTDWFSNKYLHFNEDSSFKVHLTKCLSSALTNWEYNTRVKLKLSSTAPATPQIGLPVGLSCSAFLGNIVLDGFDKAIKEEIKPAYYGRYVDDITIVMEWHETFSSTEEVWQWLSRRIDDLNIKSTSEEDSSSAIEVTYIVYPAQTAGNAEIGEVSELDEVSVTFKSDKTKLLIAEAGSGKRAIEALKNALQESSSESRLLTQTPLDAEKIGPTLITALDEAGEPAVRSSRLKTLSSTRSTLSLWLREYEQLERLCDAGSWPDHRVEFYKVVKEQLLTPLKIMDYSAFIQRVMALALNCGDISEFQSLVDHTVKAFSRIQANASPVITPKHLASGGDVYLEYRRSLCHLINELVIATNPATVSSRQKSMLIQDVFKKFEVDPEAFWRELSMDIPAIDDKFYELFNHDLALVPFKEILGPIESSSVNFSGWKFKENKVGTPVPLEVNQCDQFLLAARPTENDKGPLKEPFWQRILHRSQLRREVKNVTSQTPRLFSAVVFPTRPLSALQAISWSGYLIPVDENLDIGETTPRVTFHDIDKWTTFLRGFSIQNAVTAAKDNSNKLDPTSNTVDLVDHDHLFGITENGSRVNIPRNGSVLKDDPKIAVTSIFTDPNQITRSIAGKTSLDFDSYRTFAKLLDQIVSPSPVNSKPDYILLPELSMPAPWFEWFGNHLATKYGMGLISGITYLQGDEKHVVHNQIWASLPTSVIGFPVAAIYRQDKQVPAHSEEQNLRNFTPTKVLLPQVKWFKPPVVWHGDFAFAFLICSELTNIAHRSNLRGRIDALFVVEKNRDLSTFEALVDSAVLDIHAYVAQSNSREFGDSRIRAPKKENHERDVARVRGGLNDHFVIGKVEVRKLREFQTWHYKGTGFKPLPDGFRSEFDKKRTLFAE